MKQSTILKGIGKMSKEDMGASSLREDRAGGPSGLSHSSVSQPEALIPRAGAASLFGEDLDILARQRGGWPSDALPYAIEVIGQGDDPMVLVTGAVPVGVKRDGRPRFPTSKKNELKAGVLLSEYRKALGVSK